MDQFSLWQRTMANQGDGLDQQREILRQAFLEFRANVEQLVAEISGLLPDLTVHDISHLDALWRVADQIAGPDYPVNPAEAFVLGGAILLHDSAHVLAAYENRLDGVRATSEWRDLVAQEFGGKDPQEGAPDQRYALFQVMRQLHARQARRLPHMEWKIPGSSGKNLKLLPHPALLEYYGSLIGELAESHHWSPRKLGEVFDTRHLNAPAFLAPATWQVDALKIGFLLRTADAAHIDALRAPWFLFALRQPSGVSADHWRFQAKLGQPTRTDNGEIRLTSGSAFGTDERKAWWLAYDTACMIDRELRSAHMIMRDLGRRTFAANAVARVSTPEAFAKEVLVSGWEPINVAPKISDISKVIANLGGAKLYGDNPAWALRELLQNSSDAVRSLRALGNIGKNEGAIEVSLERKNSENWLHVCDTGIGMSRHVLTEVLLDFGTSFWASELSRTELPGLAATGFKPIGKFGIGFFSIFMLGSRVIVNTRRFRKAIGDSSDQWLLEFGDTVDKRPMLRQPKLTEELKRCGTKISVRVEDGVLRKMLGVYGGAWKIEGIDHTYDATGESDHYKNKPKKLERIVASLCPTLDIAVQVKVGTAESNEVIRPNDWIELDADTLLKRLYVSIEEDSPLRASSTLSSLLGSSGEVIGRIRHAHGYGSEAVCTHGGIRSGSVPQLMGVVLADNSPDLARKESIPIASIENWRHWANNVLDLAGDRDSGASADLHPLSPDRDLSIYVVNEKYLNNDALKNWLQSRSEVIIYNDRFEHDEYDEMSRDTFRDGIKVDPEVVFLPYTTDRLTKFIGVPSIDYQDRFEQILQLAWGTSFEKSSGDAVVGHVGIQEIERSVCFYERTQE